MQIAQRNRFWFCAVFAAGLSLFGATSQAQNFPDKPVHIVVGVAAGGGADTVARAYAQRLSEIWGQSVVVDNRTGAAGAGGNEFVVKSKADGLTLLVTSDDITALSAVRTDLPYDMERDFVPVALLTKASVVLAVNPSLQVNNVKELIALAQSKPGKLSYGSAGIGGVVHLLSTSFASKAKINVLHVPYKGSAEAIVAVAGGEIDMLFTSPAPVQGLAQAGKVKLIAVSSEQRWPSAPAIPTVSESGLPGWTFNTWFGMFAPQGLPKDVLANINAAVAKASQSPELRAAFAKLNWEPEAETPAQFDKFVRDDLRDLKEDAKLGGIKAQ